MSEVWRPNLWLGLTLGWKAVLLVLGLFLAYEGRRLKLKHVNDSRFVAMSVYNVAILSLVTGPIVTFLIKSQQDASFGFTAATVLICTWMSMGLIFVPKMLYVYKVPPTHAERQYREGHKLSTAGLEQSSSKKLTKEEERKMAELRAEHEDILRQIAAKEARIAEVKAQLARRRTLRASNTHTTTAQLEVSAESGSSRPRKSASGQLNDSAEPLLDESDDVIL